jgi:hypothetical protein
VVDGVGDPVQRVADDPLVRPNAAATKVSTSRSAIRLLSRNLISKPENRLRSVAYLIIKRLLGKLDNRIGDYAVKPLGSGDQSDFPTLVGRVRAASRER